MYIKNLKMRDFRNYSFAEIEFARGFNIIYGNNAQGKTNILEALFLCASGRSHRTSKDLDLIRISKQEYYVELGLAKEREDVTIEISNRIEGKKRIRVNEIPVRKYGDLMGQLNAVIFSPEDLLIIKEGPSGRRRFLDITISQLKPSYFYDLQQYSKILTQRNMLLKEIQHKKGLMDTLEVWNINLVKTGSRIMKVRNEFLKRLCKAARNNHGKLTNNAENLEIKYIPSIEAVDFGSVEEIEKKFMNGIEKSINKDIARSSTTYGPQRDDYDIYLDGMNVRLYGSQGQQRTAILSLKLSEIDIMKEETDEYPVLLLDDVMSELDGKRQEYLFSNLKEIQTFITCTDRNFFNERTNTGSKFFNVKEGVINTNTDIH